MNAGMVGMTNLEGLVNVDCNIKYYMGIKCSKDFRDIFRAKTQMLEGFQDNHNNMYMDKELRCGGATWRWTRSHISHVMLTGT